MSEISVSQLAEMMGAPVDVLIEKLQAKGIEASDTNSKISDKEKLKLLEIIREGASSTATSTNPKSLTEKNITKKVMPRSVSVMNIDFGVVKRYLSDRGFGFVTRTFQSSHQSEVFFHIKNIKRTHPDLAEKLDNDAAADTIYFWYETDNTSKGEQICNVLTPDDINSKVLDNLPNFVKKIESIWTDIDSTLPVWLRDITDDLVGIDRTNELSLERDGLERERRELEEKRQKEWDAQQKIEEENLQMQEEAEEKEFEQLVAEMKPLGITKSNEVSCYIMKNRLGNKYKNISGIVMMEQDGTSWDFKGGFPPDIYARLCEQLGLSNQGSRARAVGFKSFKDL